MAKLTIRKTGTDILEDINRTELSQDENQIYVIAPSEWKTWDAMQTNLPGTAAADDLELTTGTLGTNFPCIQTGDLKAAGATTRYAATTVKIPPEYDDGETITIRVSGGMLTTVSDTTATIDFEAYNNDGDNTSSADLVTTAAQSINSLTFANKDFVVTPTNVLRGDELVIRMAIAVNDGATGTAVIGCAGKVSLLLDVRG